MEEWTICIEANGFGAMYQSIMLGLAFCRKNGFIYAHTPFRQIHHGVTPREGNVFCGFFNKYPLATNKTKKIEYNGELWGADPDEYLTEEVINEIRHNYQDIPKPKIEPHNNYICIHIRRGDISKEEHPNRWDSTLKYINYISWIKTYYPNLPIIILSQGEAKDFVDLTETHDDIQLRLNGMPLVDFNFMVQAKVLVLARSSYSYTAGILNENTVLCDAISNNRWFHKPLSKWKTIDEIRF
jgi:hypothetical protein